MRGGNRNTKSSVDLIFVNRNYRNGYKSTHTRRQEKLK